MAARRNSHFKVPKVFYHSFVRLDRVLTTEEEISFPTIQVAPMVGLMSLDPQDPCRATWRGSSGYREGREGRRGSTEVERDSFGSSATSQLLSSLAVLKRRHQLGCVKVAFRRMPFSTAAKLCFSDRCFGSGLLYSGFQVEGLPSNHRPSGVK